MNLRIVGGRAVVCLVSMLATLSLAGSASGQFGPPVQFTVTNRTEASVSISWINFQGREVHFATLPAGVNATINTTPGVLYIVRKPGDGREIQRFVGARGIKNIDISLPLSPPPRPTDPGRTDPDKAGPGKSDSQVTLVFENHRSKPVQFLWVEGGVEKPYGVLKTGESRKQETWKGHEWVVRDEQSKKELQRLTASADAEVELSDAPPPKPGANNLTVTFVNQTSAAVSLFWINRLGQEKPYGPIDAGKSRTQKTAVGAAWVVRDPGTGNELKRVSATSSGQVLITAARPLPPPPAPTPSIKGAMTPIDAAAVDRAPSMMPFVNADESLDVAWVRSDGRIVVSSFSAPKGYAPVAHLEVRGALGFLGGFTKDSAGNSYVLSLVRENAAGGIKDFRPGIAQLHHIPSGDAKPTLLADLNSSTFITPANSASAPAPAIVNPLGDQQKNRGTGRLTTTADGTLFSMFTQNWGWDGSVYHQRARLIGVSPDAQSVYARGGYWGHCADLRMLPDGNEIVLTQANERGLNISKVGPADDGSIQWSGNQLIFDAHDNHSCRLRLANLVKTGGGYMLAYLYGPKGHMWDSSAIAVEQPSKDDVFVMLMPTDVVSQPDKASQLKETWTIPAGVNSKRLVNYTNSGVATARRLNAVPLGDGKTVLLWEKWTLTNWLDKGIAPNWGSYGDTWAMVIDDEGNQLVAPKSLGAVRLQKESDAFLLPESQRAGWICGDAANNRLMLHTVDENLRLQSTPLVLK